VFILALANLAKDTTTSNSQLVDKNTNEAVAGAQFPRTWARFLKRTCDDDQCPYSDFACGKNTVFVCKTKYTDGTVREKKTMCLNYCHAVKELGGENVYSCGVCTP